MKTCPHCNKPLDPYANDSRTKGWKHRNGSERWNPHGGYGGVYKIVRLSSGEALVVLVTPSRRAFTRKVEYHSLCFYTESGVYVRANVRGQYRTKIEAQVAGVDAAKSVTSAQLVAAEELLKVRDRS